MENYLMIDGVKIELTEEQLKQIRGEKKNPFDRVEKYKPYLYINDAGIAITTTELGAERDNKRYNAANYFNNVKLSNKFAVYDMLHKLLRRFSYQNGGGNELWDGEKYHHYVYYDTEFRTDCEACNQQLETTYFPTEQIARRAIEEIIKPYIKAHRQNFKGIEVE